MSEISNMEAGQDCSKNLREKDINELKVAWLLPSVAAGAHWQPILSHFQYSFNNTRFYTTNVWKEFDHNASYAKAFRQLGNLKSILADTEGMGYHHGFLVLPFNIIFHLVKFKPSVIIANAFSIWTLLAVLLKPLFRWKIIVLYEGSTPSSDFKQSKLRSLIRHFISKHTNLFIANTDTARDYVCGFLKVDEKKVLAGHYLLPDITLMNINSQATALETLEIQHPIFLYIGQIITRKGIFQLLEACSSLKSKGFNNYSLLMIGDGAERGQFEAKIHQRQLHDQVICLGRIDYSQLGAYIQSADVFIFPTYEDTWGMSAVEAMAFGKPILCSKHSGASELVNDGGNGYLVEPKNPEDIALKMESLISDPALIHQMSIKAETLATQIDVSKAIETLEKAIDAVVQL